MRGRSVIHRYLDPGETLGEVLGGFIMALTFTLGVRLFAAVSQSETHELVMAVVGCNIAWGVIDATLFVLNSLFHRSRRARFFRMLKSVRSEVEALAAVQEEFGLEDVPLAVHPEDRDRLYQSMIALSSRATPARVGLRRQDFVSAFIVFALVSATALPGVIPLLLISDSNLALHVSNWVLIALLFLVGYWWGHYTDAPPWRTGLTAMLLGVFMVLVAVALGG
jgi:VIT1/CCC1 family predicted Fe2+/Mn2+ transporter